jgi:hypothetical protein
MRYCEIHVRLPDALLHPMQAFIRHEDAVTYEEMVTWSVRPARDVEYALYYVEGDIEAYREAVGAVETVLACEITAIDERSAHVWVCEETRPETRAWRQAFAGQHLVVVPPICFDSDAGMDLTLVGDGEDIQTVLADIPDAVDVTVRRVGRYDRRGGTTAAVLSDRQLDALGHALAIGYYELPREGTLRDVADALDCAESTASELLRRAERSVLSHALARYGGQTGSTADGTGTRPAPSS